MEYNNISQELQTLCFNASIGHGTYDDIHQWLLFNKTNPDIVSSGIVLEILIRCKAPLYVVETYINILREAGKMISELGRHFLHIACSVGTSFEVFKILFENNYYGIHTKDSDGNLPLHHACMKGMDISPEIISTLVWSADEHCYSLNNDGFSTKDLLSNVAMYKNETGMILLHHIARSTMVTAKVIEFVVDAYPSGIFTPDNNGMLPFHHYLLYSWIWDIDVVYTLLLLYPDAVANK